MPEDNKHYCHQHENLKSFTEVHQYGKVHISCTPYIICVSDYLSILKKTTVNNKLLVTKYMWFTAATSLSSVFTSREIINGKYAF
jgi:hypothetical protein